MAHHKSALKRIRQTKKLRLYNRFNKKMVKEAIKAVRAVKTFEEGIEKLKTATKILDKVSSKKIMHKNAASNQKSGLAKYVNSLKASN